MATEKTNLTQVFATNVDKGPAPIEVPLPITASDLIATNTLPLLGKDDKISIMESCLALSRFETQFREIVNAAKAREARLNSELESAFKNAGADPESWVLNKETFVFEPRRNGE